LTTELPVGQVRRTRGRTLTRGECALLSDLTWTIGSLHTDREHARATQFGDTILAGAVLLSVAVGLINTSDLYRELLTDHGVQVLAALGADAKYRRPLYPGETVYVETAIEAVRASRSKPGDEILTFHDRVVNQNADLLMEIRRAWHIRRSTSEERQP
jgi:acyl dehydratase